MSEQQLSTEVSSPSKKHGVFFSELLRFALITILIVLPFRLWVAQPFIVSGSSMDPTFENGEYLIVDELTYHFDKPIRGDVIIFRFPQDTTKFFIKRIIGLPGETIIINGSTVTIENEEHPEGFTLDEGYLVHQTYSNIRVALGEEEYFVMGDNRPASSDSRIWGPLTEDLIIGRAFVRLLPMTNISVFPGKHRYLNDTVILDDTGAESDVE